MALAMINCDDNIKMTPLKTVRATQTRLHPQLKNFRDRLVGLVSSLFPVFIQTQLLAQRAPDQGPVWFCIPN
jgi:hypothetical protein